MNNDHLYTLDELFEILEEIKEKGCGEINWPKICYCLVLEIKELKEYIGYLHEMIPQKYKKFNPKHGENPFFSKSDIFGLHSTEKEREDSMKRMQEYKEKYNQDYPEFFRQPNAEESLTSSE